MYRLKFEIFVEKEPKNTLEAAETLRLAMAEIICPEEFVSWAEEKEDKNEIL